MIQITYHPDKVIEDEDSNATLLALARKHGIPHVSACGGNGRCSTCRVLVLSGRDNLTPPTEIEARLARQKGLEGDIRLACQTKAHGPVTVRRLVLDENDQEMALVDSVQSTGRETRLAILFSDIRDFTPFAESHLTYDVVHILNRYFHRMGGAVLRHGGHIDKYIGDGLMVLFGLEHGDPARACEQAVLAALDMLAELPRFNDYLSRYFDVELKIGIGIHVGEVIVAELGHPQNRPLTAIGDAVNVASRIESATKDAGVPLLISRPVQALLAGKIALGRRFQTSLKGKSGFAELWEVEGPSVAGKL